LCGVHLVIQWAIPNVHETYSLVKGVISDGVSTTEWSFWASN